MQGKKNYGFSFPYLGNDYTIINVLKSNYLNLTLKQANLLKVAGNGVVNGPLYNTHVYGCIAILLLFDKKTILATEIVNSMELHLYLY